MQPCMEVKRGGHGRDFIGFGDHLCLSVGHEECRVNLRLNFLTYVNEILWISRKKLIDQDVGRAN